MKPLMILAMMLMGLAAGVTPTFAATGNPRVLPKGTEGPDVRAKVEPKGLEGPDVRHFPIPPFRNTEGPETR